jgi:hypothetical protein
LLRADDDGLNAGGVVAREVLAQLRQPATAIRSEGAPDENDENRGNTSVVVEGDGSAEA